MKFMPVSFRRTHLTRLLLDVPLMGCRLCNYLNLCSLIRLNGRQLLTLFFPKIYFIKLSMVISLYMQLSAALPHIKCHSKCCLLLYQLKESLNGTLAVKSNSCPTFSPAVLVIAAAHWLISSGDESQ